MAILLGCDGGETQLRATIGPEGGFLRGETVGLDVPPGALDTSTSIEIERVAVPPGYRATGGAAYRFHPEGTRFALPVTVRFAVGPREEAATIFWSRAEAPDVLEPLSTRLDGGHVLASVEHFSLGLAGWQLDGPRDGGIDASPPDGAGLDDAGGDAAGLDHDGGAPDAAGPMDAGSGDAGSLPGITCVVAERNPDCVTSETTTYEDVPFSFHPQVDVYGQFGALTSPLYAFNILYNSPGPVPFGGDAAGVHYGTGISSTTPELTRAGLVLTANMDVGRNGSPCVKTPGAVPLVAIRCTGSTLLAAPSCPYVDTSSTVGVPLACSVTRRDASCSATTTVEAPRFWLASGAHGPQSELHVDSPAFSELFGGRFYREEPCDTYVDDVRVPFPSARFARSGGQIAIPDLFASGGGTCSDELGRPQPRLRLSCRGEASLVAAP